MTRKPKQSQKKKSSSSNSETATEEFIKIIQDFRNDICLSFPEHKDHLDSLSNDQLYVYCKSIYPEAFFDILYENDTLFDNEKSKYLLPDMDFSIIMRDESLSEQSKKTIWKYLQLVLFCVCNNVENKKDFGDANYLFEAIDENELHEKIQQSMDEMKNIFMNMDSCGNEGLNGLNDFAESMFSDMSAAFADATDMSGAPGGLPDMMDAEKMKDHLSGIMNGKIGSLAKEIAEEASKELGIDENDMDPEKQQEFMKTLFKNPTKLLGIVKNIGSKLEDKFKSGDLKQSELLEEAQEIMEKMKDMPGMKQMMSSLGMGAGGNFDFKGMANKMQQNMRNAKMKERMQEKMRRNREAREEFVTRTQQQQAETAAADTGNLSQVNDDVFVWNDDNSNPSQPLQKSCASSSPGSKTNNNKKRKKKNKKH